MDLSRVPILGAAALMLLGMLALVVWIFRAVFQAARGVAQTLGASPAEPLQALGLKVTSDPVGGLGDGHWKGVPVKVAWRMTAAPYAGDFTPPPEFSTTVVAFFDPPLTLGISIDEERGAPACGVPGLDGELRLSEPLSATTHGLLSQWAPHIRHVLDAPGRLQIRDEHVAIGFDEILSDPGLLSAALDHIARLHTGMRGQV